MPRSVIHTISGIYLITHIASLRQYVGSSANLELRWLDHQNSLQRKRHHSRYLQRVWNKYGADAFQWEILEECPTEKLLSREQWYLDNWEVVFNTCRIAGSPLGIKHTEESRRNMSEAHKGKRLSEAAKEKLRIFNTGLKQKPYSESRRKNMSDAQKGKCVPKAVRAKISETMKGRKHTPEAIRNMKIAAKNRSVRKAVILDL